MSKEMRKQINKIRNFGQFLNEIGVDIYTKEIKKTLTENDFSVLNIYDVENVSGLISSFNLNGLIPKYLYEGIDF
jgi:hypothetical protein